MKSRDGKNKGIALVVVIIVGLVLSMLGFGLLKLAEMEYSLTHKDIRKAKAFYLAEAGIANFVTNAYARNFADIGETSFEGGTYKVEVFDDDDIVIPYAIATGVAGWPS